MKKIHYRKTMPFLLFLLIFFFAFNPENISSAENFSEHFDSLVIKELNLARTNPLEYSRILREKRNLYKDKRIRLKKNLYLKTKEGVAALDEAVAFLKKQKKLEKLGLSHGMSYGALDHVRDQAKSGALGHKGSDGSMVWDRVSRYGRWRFTVAENIAYGGFSPRDVVSMLIIDDGVKDRGHRKNIFNPAFRISGVAHGNHPKYGTICVITLASGYEEKKPFVFY